MSDVEFRENNQVKWVGVRPAHGGEHLLVSAFIANGTVTLYTVPSGKTLYLTFSTIMTGQLANGFMSLTLYNGAGVFQHYLHLANVSNSGGTSDTSDNYWPPIEIPENWTIRLVSSIAALTVHGTIHGWVE